ncbi:polymerase [Thermosipho melanesiensis]|uniref:Flagellar Assembly Protein A N-terminal region domain-containing protein n=2 Tax=Thermosipho melanesiensis TaxID=46541 RepID=A6LN78_THEM4|nr:FapA family protein [Thermosipho melanesiensis]ABR31379.1 protein of unknown function DUF342 [Thermosipho melanesiensis BI429]APT74439.1 hypothetical protein BW47_08145 [Thermosipho melanesiensis]OOC36401.1 polymerase [Thermosipho melanesiensis]OOC37219.1 polymerase [Thermosipho melanesiensis]OOC37971.1 polymerase [Thermosipho melanesiensis]
MLINVKVSEDKMSASVILEKTSDEERITPKDILEALNGEGIVFGINRDVITRICNEPEFNVPIKVVFGKPPGNGIDGSIEFVDFEKSSENKKGKIDFREFPSHRRIIVKKGQKIATIIPPTKGEDGIDVFGNTIPGLDGKEVEIKLGKNVERIDNEIFSKIDGILKVDSETNFIDVEETLEIKGDVDYSVGNIDFPGVVVIKGDVKPGFVVRAKRDIEVNGVIEAATVISLEGSIKANGIKGREKGIVKCKKNLNVKFAENAIIEAETVKFADLLNNCKVKARKSIFSENGKGVIVGGTYLAGFEIIAEEIGTELAIPTHLEVGISPELLEERNLLRTQIMLDKQNAEKLLRILKQYKSLKEKNVEISEDKKKLFLKSSNTLMVIKEQLEKNTVRLHEIEEKIQSTKVNAKIVAKKIIYPGVEVAIQGVKYYINKPMSKVVLKLADEKIVVGGYSE